MKRTELRQLVRCFGEGQGSLTGQSVPLLVLPASTLLRVGEEVDVELLRAPPLPTTLRHRVARLETACGLRSLLAKDA